MMFMFKDKKMSKKQLYEKFKGFLTSNDFNFSEDEKEILQFVAKTFIDKEFHTSDVILENGKSSYLMRKDHYSEIISDLEQKIGNAEDYADSLEKIVDDLQSSIDDAMHIINQQN